MELETILDISEIVKSPNLASHLSEQDLAKIGVIVWSEWDIDRQSR